MKQDDPQILALAAGVIPGTHGREADFKRKNSELRPRLRDVSSCGENLGLGVEPASSLLITENELQLPGKITRGRSHARSPAPWALTDQQHL